MRLDRILPEEQALELLRSAEYGILSMNTADGGYGIPLNYVWDGDSSIYIHCALEGKKIDAIKADGRVSFLVIGHVRLLPEQLSTERESIILTGTAHIGLSDEEKKKGLRLLVQKLTPAHPAHCIERALDKVEVIRLDIDTFSGKGKMPKAVVKMEHAALYVRNLDAARDFFVKYLGGKSNTGYHNPKTDFRSYFLTFAGGSRLEIMTRPEVMDAAPEYATGYAHVAFSVGSKAAVDELTDRLKADGYAVKSGPRTTGDGYYESCIAGPEGITIEITI
jgi:lactoylglutathione lyase